MDKYSRSKAFSIATSTLISYLLAARLCFSRPQFYNTQLGGGAWPNYLSSQLLASRGIDFYSLRNAQPQLSEQYNNQLALSTQPGRSGNPVNLADNFGFSYGVRFGDLINRGGAFGSSNTLGSGLASGINSANLYDNGYGGGAQTYGFGTAQVPSAYNGLGGGLATTQGQSFTSGGQWPYSYYNTNGAGNFGSASLLG